MGGAWTRRAAWPPSSHRHGSTPAAHPVRPLPQVEEPPPTPPFGLHCAQLCASIPSLLEGAKRFVGVDVVWAVRVLLSGRVLRWDGTLANARIWLQFPENSMPGR